MAQRVPVNSNEQKAAERAHATAQVVRGQAEPVSIRLFRTLVAYQAAFDALREAEDEAIAAMERGGQATQRADWKAAGTAYNEATVKWQEVISTKVELTSVPDDEIKNVRAVAKEWLAANAALFGLFSLGGVVFGRDVVGELGDKAQWIVPIAALGAVIAGAAAILFGTKSAHGWPDKPDRGGYKLFKRIPIPFLRESDYDRTPKDQFRVWRCAVADLERAVWSAGVALALLVVAVGTLWADQAATGSSSVETVRLLGANERTLACGEFAELGDQGFVLLDSDGVVKTPIPAADVQAIVGATCSN